MPLAPKPKQGKVESCFHWNLSLIPPMRPVIFSPENPENLLKTGKSTWDQLRPPWGTGTVSFTLIQTPPSDGAFVTCPWALAGLPSPGLMHGPLEEQHQISRWLWKTRPVHHLLPPGSPPDGTQPKYLHPKYTAFCLLVLVKLPKTLLPLLGVMADDKSLSLKRECSWPVPPAYEE